jgi:hypothetical protein
MADDKPVTPPPPPPPKVRLVKDNSGGKGKSKK